MPLHPAAAAGSALFDALAAFGASASIPTGATLTARWGDGPRLATLAWALPNAPAHTQMALHALDRRADMAAALEAWALDTPLMWAHRESGLLTAQDHARPVVQIAFTYTGARPCLPTRVDLTLPTHDRAGLLTQHSHIATPVGKKGVELLRLLRALSSTQGPLCLWMSTQHQAKEQRFVAGPGIASAVLVDRLLRAAPTTLKSATYTPVLAEHTAIFRAYPRGTPDDTPAIW